MGQNFAGLVIGGLIDVGPADVVVNTQTDALVLDCRIRLQESTEILRLDVFDDIDGIGLQLRSLTV